MEALEGGAELHLASFCPADAELRLVGTDDPAFAALCRGLLAADTRREQGPRRRSRPRRGSSCWPPAPQSPGPGLLPTAGPRGPWQNGTVRVLLNIACTKMMPAVLLAGSGLVQRFYATDIADRSRAAGHCRAARPRRGGPGTGKPHQVEPRGTSH